MSLNNDLQRHHNKQATTAVRCLCEWKQRKNDYDEESESEIKIHKINDGSMNDVKITTNISKFESAVCIKRIMPYNTQSVNGQMTEESKDAKHD